MQVSLQQVQAHTGRVTEQARSKFYTMGVWLVRFLSYVVSGKWIVDFTRWLVTTAGTIAESAFLLATVYVTINNVAHRLVAWLLPNAAILTLNQISVIAFSVLPELIIFAALKVTFDHWQMVARTKKVHALLWAIAYTLPTIIFLVMTILTLTSFVSVEAVADSAPQATGNMLVLRCLAGWSYGVIQMLWASLGKEGYAKIFDRLKSEVAALTTTLTESNAKVSHLQNEYTLLLAKVAEQEKEITSLNVALASKKVTRRASESVTAELPVITPAEESSAAPVSSEKHARLRELVTASMLQGKKPNLKQIGSEIDMSYTTVRKYARPIIKEVTSEHAAIPKMSLVK